MHHALFSNDGVDKVGRCHIKNRVVGGDPGCGDTGAAKPEQFVAVTLFAVGAAGLALFFGARERDDDEILHEGQEASALMKHEVIRQALVDMEASCWADFSESDPGDTEVREDAKRMLRAIRMFVGASAVIARDRPTRVISKP